MHLRDIASLLLLASLLSLQLQLSLGAQESGLKPQASGNSHNSHQVDQDEDDDDDIFYDVEDEISFDESAAENTCATSNKLDCEWCCSEQGFDLPFWNLAIGQCFCYVTYGEENICKNETQTGEGCRKCCVDNGYHESDFPRTLNGDQCYCSAPDHQLFEASLKSNQRRA